MMYDVIILGSGPAGYTAALYTSRAFLKTLIITGIQEGGQLTTTTEIENFPGFPKGIMGPQLMMDMKSQVTRFGAEIIQDSVTSIKKNGKSLTVAVGNKTFEGKTVIVATGASAMYLGLPSEKKLSEKGYLRALYVTDSSSAEKRSWLSGEETPPWKKRYFLRHLLPK